MPSKDGIRGKIPGISRCCSLEYALKEFTVNCEAAGMKLSTSTCEASGSLLEKYNSVIH